MCCRDVYIHRWYLESSKNRRSDTLSPWVVHTFYFLKLFHLIMHYSCMHALYCIVRFGDWNHHHILCSLSNRSLDTFLGGSVGHVCLETIKKMFLYDFCFACIVLIFRYLKNSCTTNLNLFNWIMHSPLALSPPSISSNIQSYLKS